MSLWWAYAALVLALGLLQSLAALQQYLSRGGGHAWEPILWELSSALCVGVLAPLIYRWHVAGLGLKSRLWQLARHGLGALGYTMAHVGGMFAIRFGVYALMGAVYETGSAQEILSYEAGKDIVSYSLIVAICHGLWLYFESQRRQQEVARLRSELAEARLSRLAEQIQPHFLFNTLNLISSVMYEDVARADRILCDLASLLRQALAAQQAGSHTVAQELALVEPYLNIMQSRFGSERLSIAVDVSDDARACLLPTLLLIAPVENAIKHDVAVASGAVRVSIGGVVTAGRLRLTVANSGTPPEREHREGAIGLANTRERLRGLYGDAASVALTASADGGSVLTISLPVQAAS